MFWYILALCSPEDTTSCAIINHPIEFETQFDCVEFAQDFGLKTDIEGVVVRDMCLSEAELKELGYSVESV